MAKQDDRVERAAPLSLALCVENLSVRINHNQILKDLTFEVAPGELLAILGPSGSGKTTLLNVLAGFVQPEQGTVRLGDTIISSPDHVVPSDQRGIGFVFQSYALWPHLNVLDTVAYPLLRQGEARAHARKQALEILTRLGLDPLSRRLPHELSGGQQQRVGLARALAARPRLLLFDEPTANLDEFWKVDLQMEIRQRQRSWGATGLYVSHHVPEAFSVADRVMVLAQGQVRQIGSPLEIYQEPEDKVVADISGSYSLVDGVVESVPRSGTAVVNLMGQSFPVSINQGIAADTKKFIYRPEWGMIGDDGLSAKVVDMRFQGSFVDYFLQIDDIQLQHRQLGSPTLQVGEQTHWKPKRLARWSGGN